MAKRKMLIVGNWKMAPEREEEAASIFSGIKRAAARSGAQVAVCPPDLFVRKLVKLAGTSSVRVGVQDVFEESAGLHTGKRTASQAYNAGARLAIIGHSEMRAWGDDDEVVGKKTAEAVKAGLIAIVCVGDSVRDGDGGYLSVIRNQVLAALKEVQRESFHKSIVIAYEPLWTVGRADFATMKPHDVHETALFIRKTISDTYGRSYADAVKILYGGSVSEESAADMVKEGGVDGLLVGRQSLDAKAFGAILSSCNGH